MHGQQTPSIPDTTKRIPKPKAIHLPHEKKEVTIKINPNNMREKTSSGGIALAINSPLFIKQ